MYSRRMCCIAVLPNCGKHAVAVSLAALSMEAGTNLFFFIVFPQSFKIKEGEQNTYLSIMAMAED